MTRRYLAFIIGVNAVISLAITLLALWLVELRRPDPEQLASIITPRPQVILAATPAPATTPQPQPVAANQAATPTTGSFQPQGEPYTVRSGDSLSSIAGRFNITLNELLQTNNLENPDIVFVGQRIYLPANAREIPQESNNSTSNVGPSQDAQQQIDAAPAGEIRITQISGTGELDSEVLLVVNEGDAALNLQGWRITYDGGPTYAFLDFPIFPGGSVRLHSGSGEDSSIDLYWQQTESVWTSQRSAKLIDNQGRLVHEFTIP